MNCYICLVETGCASRAAVAVCQRCGAGMCGAHLRELPAPPVVGLAGTPRSVLLCCPGSTTHVGAPCEAAGRAQQIRREVVGKAQAERRPAESSRGCRGGGTLSQPSAPWVAYSYEPERAVCQRLEPSLLVSSPCRPCGCCSHGLRGLSEAMSDCDGVVTIKLSTVTHA